MARITIVVPVYNDEAYVGECLDSLTGQTLTDVEILCIDDASSDGSLRILEEYAARDGRISVIRQESNQGQLCARKRGVEQASGDFITFVDSDDTLTANACEVMLEVAKDKDADILHFDLNVISDRAWLVQAMLEAIGPTEGWLHGLEILDNHFNVRSGGTNVVAKLYKAGFLKNVFCEVPIIPQMLMGDIYTTFFIDNCAENCYGLTGDNYRLYNYFIDRGTSGDTHTSISAFKRYSRTGIALKEVEKYLEEKSAGEIERTALYNMTRRMVAGTLGHFYRLHDYDYDEAEKVFFQNYATNKTAIAFLMELENKYRYDAEKFQQEINDQRVLNDQRSKSLQESYEQRLKLLQESYEQRLLKQDEEHRQEIQIIQGTVSWRIGRILTWLPRKIRSVILRWRENKIL